ncbi:MAG: HAD-IIIC family phosphatase [Acidobacteriota bacterium]
MSAQSKLAELARNSSIKCVVWDLDNTLWKGILLEDNDVELRPEVVQIIKVLDERGILHSVASKNDYFSAVEKLKELQLLEYFLYPQISWSTKVKGIETIAKSLNIGLDAIAFIDDQPFERDEVAHTLPMIMCLDAARLDHLLEMSEMMPRFITEDSKARRFMYARDIKRKQVEDEFVGPKEEFLATLRMHFCIELAQAEDLRRAEELTVRTHQLNSTGHTYSYEELDEFRQSDSHLLLVGSLDDRYGSYGKIGLALVECSPGHWNVKLLLMSCRVMSTGVGTIMINYIRQFARSIGVKLTAEFLPTERNRMMYVTYKFAGFREIDKRYGLIRLENDLGSVPAFPDYIRVSVPRIQP